MQEAFTFNMKEAISFDNNQQIQEMLGIGLEPVISMEENNGTLSIRGVMELKGEYIKSDSPDELLELRSDAISVERVESLSDEVNEFFHKFLIDVSIPMERVPSLDAVAVDVNHFDYSLESAKEMIIEAVLTIQGIEEPEVVTDNEEEATLPAFDNDRLDEEEETADGSFHIDVEEEEIVDESEEEVIELVEEDVRNEEVQENINEEEVEEQVVEERSESTDEAETSAISIEEEEEEQEEQPEDIFHVQGREERADDTTYLLNIFAEEEASSYSRLKLYIVQPDDHMTSIAERYQVSPRQIMRTNRLDDEDISAGQLIYIPIVSEE
ncbi:stage VI sporulation protein D [Gracilibacillus sp. S3-1-1]|uniref:Stage VI sporulation protein D n=1 Tax=Gracilibacillus pellucidus TaxID=3095368 RepID=A0ACC6M6J7_9BACI|nr:stage VI sporulation protein D [Gracilibacillus sp. S3-1-1]MDX8046579.1 stage VI sporulation protein D [Gracilibacillus sp. S3-1-1]